MRNLVVCCDGTWNTPEQQEGGVPAPTNVVRFRNTVAEGAFDGGEQLLYYHPGVGASGGFFDRMLGGGMGIGLGKNIQSAYKWLAGAYQPEDRIFLLGFSRGAYTVRCVAGMINYCGLLKLDGQKVEQDWEQVRKAYEQGYKRRKDKPAPNWKQAEMRFHGGDGRVPIHFLGVWDTVGALGVPNDLAISNLFDRFDDFTFADNKVSEIVQSARHAVSIDEQRASFSPTLWGKGKPHQDVQELWFPGNHSDVGGGWAQTGLSDGGLKWMIDEAQAKGLVFRDDIVEQVQPNHRDVLHDKPTGLLKHLTPQPRSVPFIEDRAKFHASALDRHESPPITQAPYRQSQKLAPGESTRRSIYALEPWNDTGIWLEKGKRYKFTASGQWVDKTVACGPGGTRDGNFQVGEVIQLAGSLLGQMEGVFRWASGNEEADFRGTRRYEEYPWFSLVGAVANGGNPKSDGTPHPHETFLIGDGCDYKVRRDSGYFFAFANDAWHFYGNNRGHVMLTVERLA